MSKWISVKDRLPEDCFWVLVCCIEDGGNMNCCGYSIQHGFRDWCDSNIYNIDIANITHWMPLPDAPITENKEKELLKRIKELEDAYEALENECGF